MDALTVYQRDGLRWDLMTLSIGEHSLMKYHDLGTSFLLKLESLPRLYLILKLVSKTICHICHADGLLPSNH